MTLVAKNFCIVIIFAIHVFIIASLTVNHKFDILSLRMWKKLSTKIILSHPRLTVVEDEVELPNGHKTDYLRFEIKGNSATVIAKNNENRILIIKEYLYPANEWLYQLPGGFVPEGEDIEQGINRELMEETNLKAKRLKLLGNFYPMVRRTNSRVYVFLGTDLIEQKLEGDKEEEIEINWYLEEEIDNLIKEGKFKNSTSLGTWAIYKSIK
jgi:ADP-ribose pyrophosphatase